MEQATRENLTLCRLELLQVIQFEEIDEGQVTFIEKI